ncbi:hypothetical protein ACE6H2_026481 [Prunus campanulata]
MEKTNEIWKKKILSEREIERAKEIAESISGELGKRGDFGGSMEGSSQTPTNEDLASVSKNATKKEAAKQEKLRQRQEQEALAASASSLAVDEEDRLAANYGDVPLKEIQSKRVEDVSRPTKVGALSNALENCSVWIRGRAQTIRAVGKNISFVVLREREFTVQCVVTVQPDTVSRQMVKYVSGLSRESIIDVEGLVSVPSVEIKGTTQQVEVQVRKLYCVTKAVVLPINIEDAARSDAEIEKALQAGEKLVRVNQDTRLNNRSLDLRTPANLGIFRIQSQVGTVMDIVDRLFVTIFDTLNETCQKELEAVGRQYPFEPLKDVGVEVDPMGDLNTEAERKLGQLVLEKYGTEFYILHRYPLAVRPFYTITCHDNPAYSNSFDVFIRGEEIISGSQRVHVPELLEERAQACGIDLKTISTYLDSFRYAAPPHGGFGVGLERVVMLFCGLNNIRKTSLFPRDPLRLAP